jgi:hypothetical protein
MNMRLYEITLPLETNNGDDYDEAHEAFRRKVLDVAHGFTELPDAHGFWLEGNRLYNVRVRAYRIVCTYPRQWRGIFDAAIMLFHDQEAFFYAEIGRAIIVSRRTWRAKRRTEQC